LASSSSSAPGEAWRSLERSGASWVEALSAASCTEVVLTACVPDEGRARHLVLELAEQLTQRLSATKPHIRVRFLPLSAARGSTEARSA